MDAYLRVHVFLSIAVYCLKYTFVSLFDIPGFNVNNKKDTSLLASFNVCCMNSIRNSCLL